MNKKILLISSMLLTLILITIVIFNNTNNNESNIISNINKDTQIINNNMLTLMYETESGSGEYAETKDTTWPESGYIFNDTLSGCENGGELEYNSQNNTVNLLSNSSDRCYVYFDKYDGVWIDNVSITNVTGSSVTLSVDATSENGSITTYYYAINDSGEYKEVGSNVITINDLNKLTEYKISIYCFDSTNAKSNIYEISVSTTDVSKPIINSVSVGNITDSGFTLTVNATSDIGIARYYYIIENENISGTSISNSYTFNNLKANTNYNIQIFYEDTNGTYSEKYSLNVKTDILTLANYIKSLYTVDGENGLYYHDGDLDYGAGDNSYRYSGANPNNYVCFGSTESVCPIDYLYRIIGVFGNYVKLIKADYTTVSQTGSRGAYDGDYYDSYGDMDYYKGEIGDVAVYEWSPEYDNEWNNTVLYIQNINSDFNNYLGYTWSNCIYRNTFKLNGVEHQNFYESIAREIFNEENNSTMSIQVKYGLMYASDYAYAAYKDAWTTSLNEYNSSKIKNNNWMYMGLREWTITHVAGGSDSVLSIDDDGSLSNWSEFMIGAIRPCFYLNSNVTYESGNGNKYNPYRIGI